jgi:L-lactate utilization protein LutB
MGDDFQVQQTYDEIGQMIYDEVADMVADWGWRNEAEVAKRVRDNVLHRLDAWYEPRPDAVASAEER